MTERAIKSAERTVALFELFSAMETPLTVGEVSTALEMPQSSASMLLRKLVSLGYLDLDRVTRRYKPTLRILLLSTWMTRRFGETSAIAAALDRLHDSTGEVVMLSLQHNARMQWILTRGVDRSGLQYNAGGRDADKRIMVRSGLFASLTCSAMGRVILSLKPDHEVCSWVRRANAEAEAPQFRVSESEMLRLLGEVRRRGYAETAGSQLPNLGAFAVAVPSPLDSTPLAVSVSLRVERMAAKRSIILDGLFHVREQFSNPRLLEASAAQLSDTGQLAPSSQATAFGSAGSSAGS
jgi:IclR family KDG regulon transcriptional repressor